MSEQKAVVMLTPDEVLAKRNQQPAPLLLDVRSEEEWESHHIPGATLIPMQALASRIGELDRSRETIVICEHGMRSLSVARYLVSQAQFDSVGNMQGGMSAWTGPVEGG